MLFSICTGCEQRGSSYQEVPLIEQVELEEKLTTAPFDSSSVALFNEVIAYAGENQLERQSLGMIIQRVGEWFITSPYVAGSLDKNDRERLVIKLDGFDCVTFVESTIALSRTILDGSTRFETFGEKLVEQRYRESIVNGYCSRLHYFSEWIIRNQEKGLVTDISKEIGGLRLDKTLNFMSNHRESYPQLAANDSLFAEMLRVESALANHELFYVPQDQIRDTYNLLQSGDIIALATDIKGLDVVHTGFVYKFEEGGTGLLHASTSKGVTVSPDLQEYVENNKRQIGILVARPKA